MAVDATMRKLRVPPKFMPYLEKHRVYELFHDLGNELAMTQPKDPLIFLKNCLERLDRGRDKRLILLLTPPYLDRITLAQLISVKTGCDILSRYIVCLKPGNYYDPRALAENTAAIISTSERDGWILSDFPDTVAEAKLLIRSRVLPTHVFLFLTEKPDIHTKCNDTVRTVDTTPSILLGYDNSIYRLRELYQSSLKIININSRSLEDLANLCVRLTMKMPSRHAPKLFRVAFIGPRGSRRRTLAKLLHKRFNLVHVDMENLVNAARRSESEVGDKIRFLDKNGFPYPTKIVFDLLKARLHQKDCLERGYVLTNFPGTLEEFVLLDSTETPPNRVIFLKINEQECKNRIEDRLVNTFTGGLHSKKAINDNTLLKSQTLTHPDDESCKVIEEIKFFNKRIQAMLGYCGKTCFTVDAGGPIPALMERVEAVLMGPSPTAKPRSGKLPREHSVGEHQSNASEDSRMSYPLSHTLVVPLIDSTEMLRRFEELKRSDSRNQNIETLRPALILDESTEIVSDKPFDQLRDESRRKFSIDYKGFMGVEQLKESDNYPTSFNAE